MARVRVRHSFLYYRNSFLAGSFAVIVLFAAIYSPADLVTFFWLIPLIYINSLVWRTYFSVHPWRLRQPPQTPEDATLSYKDVRLRTRDGLELTGWYIPGKNRAAVILVHGLGASKVHMLNHARALAFDDYGILMIDLRAHGGSTGDTITGLKEAEDVLAGVEYLKSRPDVDAQKIGAVGVSLGALAVLRAARLSDTIRGVVLEGLGPACLDDHGGRPQTLQRKINYPINWLMYRFGDWMSGARIPEGVLATLPHVWPRPVLLVSAGRRYEAYFNRLFYEAAREPKELWEVPHAAHAAVYLYEPQMYRDKLRVFFKKALLGA